MLRAGLMRVKAHRGAISVFLLLSLTLGGCYWSRYAEVMEMHLQLVEEFSEKLQFFADRGEKVAPENWSEFVYPLERARDFSRIAAQRYEGRASLAAFDEALDRYAELVESPGILSGPEAAARVEQGRSNLRGAVERARAELVAESD